MLEKIDHIGIAVNSIDEALKFFRDALGLEVKHVEEVADQKVRIAFLPIGETHVELLEPTGPDSNVAKFLESKGEGIHHMAFKVSDIGAALASLKEKGLPLIDAEPRAGGGNKNIAFMHPRGTHRVLIELCEDR
jgi:methylmalonyl-CoA/ethylmalonyl-CoA epimerase